MSEPVAISPKGQETLLSRSFFLTALGLMVGSSVGSGALAVALAGSLVLSPCCLARPRVFERAADVLALETGDALFASTSSFAFEVGAGARFDLRGTKKFSFIAMERSLQIRDFLCGGPLAVAEAGEETKVDCSSSSEAIERFVPAGKADNILGGCPRYEMKRC